MDEINSLKARVHDSIFFGKSGGIVPFGMRFSADQVTFSEDYYVRGDLLERDITNDMATALAEIKNKKDEYVMLHTPHPAIRILSPAKQIGSEYLLGWFALSLVVDLIPGIRKLFTDDDRLLWLLSGALNGLNDWNNYNGVIDMATKTIVGRIACKLSPDILVHNPIRVIVEEYKIREDAMSMTNDQYISARTLAHEYIKTTFFS